MSFYRLSTLRERMNQTYRIREPDWYPAEVLWKNITSFTIATAFANDVAERRFVIPLTNHLAPTVEYNKAYYIPAAIPKNIHKGDQVVFRFYTLKDELAMLKKTTLHRTDVVRISKQIQWCFQDKHNKAEKEAADCLEYRLLTRKEIKVGEAPDPIQRCWVPKYEPEERQHWAGFNLEDLQEFLRYNTFTKYDNPIYQQRRRGEEWVDCCLPF